MDKKHKMNKWNKYALGLGVLGVFLAFGAAGTDDTRSHLSPEERKQMNIPSSDATNVVYGASLLSLAAAYACARKSKSMNKQR